MTGEFAILDDGDGGSWLLQHPESIVACDEPDAVAEGLASIEAGIARGLTAAGFFTYELGYALEPRLAPLMPRARSLPLLRLGLFRDARRLSRRAARAWLQPRTRGGGRVGALGPALDRARYRAAFATVHGLIASGDVYQVNLTFKTRLQVEGDPLSLYLDLQRRQAVVHGALIAAPGLAVLSLSPELFVRVRDGRASVRPMKGTARRGTTPEEDRTLARWLVGDEKSRAENLMIVDLMRNDLGRLAPVGGVRATDLFTVETLRTLHQMTSGVTAKLRPDVGLADLLRALFPCGSVTGAPKIRAMEIIRAVETEPRGIYTGAIGMVRRDPRGGLDLKLNVAIRTLVIDASGQGEYGVGSGVVADSAVEHEYDECLLKARWLADVAEPFALIETLRWEPAAGYALLDRHLDRLAASAAYFAIPCDREAVLRRLDDLAAGFRTAAMRVRLLLDETGDISTTAGPLAPPRQRLRYAVSTRPQPTDESFRYHKTTRRAGYETELARMKAETGCDEVVFVNERGELTEGSRTNLFVADGRRLLTPALACGLLPGTLRAELLARREAVEAVLRPADLARAEAVLLGNSVSGLVVATPVGDANAAEPARP